MLYFLYYICARFQSTDEISDPIPDNNRVLLCRRAAAPFYPVACASQHLWHSAAICRIGVETGESVGNKASQRLPDRGHAGDVPSSGCRSTAKLGNNQGIAMAVCDNHDCIHLRSDGSFRMDYPRRYKAQKQKGGEVNYPLAKD